VARPAAENEIDITLRLNRDVLLWARVRAGFAGTSVNRLIRQFLTEYAAVHPNFRNSARGSWVQHRPAVEVFQEAMHPMGAGDRAREATAPQTEPSADRD
jgi:hypothetical protein